MSNKNLLIVSNAFYPENSPRSIRTTELAKELVKQGHQVTLVSHPKPGVEEHCKQNGIFFKTLESITYPIPKVKGSGVVRLFWRAITRLSSLLLEYPNIQLIFLVKKALKNEKGYDGIISVAVPHPIHWGVARIYSRNLAKTWIADCGDPYVGNVNDTFKKPFYFKYIENWTFNKVDYITVPFEGARKGYAEEVQSKIKIIPQGLSFPSVETNSNYLREDKQVQFAYSGNIGSYQKYLKVFSEQLNQITLDYKLFIYTNEREVWTNVLSEETLKKCVISDYLDRNKLLMELSKMDFLLHFPYEVELQKSLKLVDYTYLNKPILSYRFSDANSSRLQNFLNKNFDYESQDINIEDYKIENVTKKFLELIP